MIDLKELERFSTQLTKLQTLYSDLEFQIKTKDTPRITNKELLYRYIKEDAYSSDDLKTAQRRLDRFEDFFKGSYPYSQNFYLTSEEYRNLDNSQPNIRNICDCFFNHILSHRYIVISNADNECKYNIPYYFIPIFSAFVYELYTILKKKETKSLILPLQLFKNIARNAYVLLKNIDNEKDTDHSLNFPNLNETEKKHYIIIIFLLYALFVLYLIQYNNHQIFHGCPLPILYPIPNNTHQSFYGRPLLYKNLTNYTL